MDLWRGRGGGEGRIELLVAAVEAEKKRALGSTLGVRAPFKSPPHVDPRVVVVQLVGVGLGWVGCESCSEPRDQS